MVLATEISGVDVHTTIVCPVVGQSNNELHPGLLSSSNDLVEWLQVDLLSTVVEILHDIVGSTCALTAILRESTSDGGAILVVETPGAEDLQSGLLCSSETSLDV